MGNWERVTNAESRERYHEMLAASNPAYASANLAGLNRRLDERGGRAFLYTETGPPAFRLLLLLAPDSVDASAWKIVNAVPIGDYDPAGAIKIAWRQIRHVLDEVGATSFYGTPLKDYGDPKMNAFFGCVPDLCWELDAEEEAAGRKFRYVFKRRRERTAEDERFEGPRASGGVARAGHGT